MAAKASEGVETDARSVDYTVPLTEAAENGTITPDEYVRRRAGMVGQGNILENLIIPLFMMLWRKLFPGGGARQIKRRV
jgi:hypothetical protein